MNERPVQLWTPADDERLRKLAAEGRTARTNCGAAEAISVFSSRPGNDPEGRVGEGEGEMIAA